MSPEIIIFGTGEDGTIHSDGSNFLLQGTNNGSTYLRGSTISIAVNGGSGSYGNVTNNYGSGSGSSWRGLCMTSQEAAGEYKQGLACPPLVDTSHNILQ